MAHEPQKSGDNNPKANAPGKMYTSEAPTMLAFLAPASALAPAVELVPAAAGAAAAAEGAVVVGGTAAAAEGTAATVALVSNPVGWGILAGVAVVAIGGGAYYFYKKNHTETKAQAKTETRPEHKAEPNTNVQVRDREKPRPCPVCGLAPDPYPALPPPPYVVPPPRPPMDSETMPPLTVYQRTSVIVKRARVWKMPNGGYIHVDTLHGGKDAELETYDSQRKHLGAICPRCGITFPGSKVPGRRLPKN